MLGIWNKAKVRILARRSFQYVFLPGYVCEGLGVHRVYLKPRSGWSITVLESGLAFQTFFKTCREAKEKATQLLCIEGLWNNSLEAFAGGFREVDVNRVNQILGTEWVAGAVGRDVRITLEHRKENHAQPA